MKQLCNESVHCIGTTDALQAVYDLVISKSMKGSKWYVYGCQGCRETGKVVAISKQSGGVWHGASTDHDTPLTGKGGL